MAEMSVRDAFLQQAAACAALESPFTAQLCRLLGERLTMGNAVADRILNWPGDASAVGDSVPLRLAGALHALVLEGRSEALIARYPPHQREEDEALWQAVESALIAEETFILHRLDGPPQTNEVRRSAATLPMFLEAARRFGLPLALSEVGASAGLNLHLDGYRITLGDKSWGEATSPVQIRPRWHGAPPPDLPLNILSRAGCDLLPVDPSRAEDRERMLSFIWPDQPERMVRTRAALDLAAKSDIRVERCDAVDWLARRLETPMPGVAQVIYSTIAWQYFPADKQREGAALIHAAGAQATEEAPIIWARMEGDSGRPGAALTMTFWPGGETRLVGRADYHGRWIDWKGIS
ncbi:MAG: hypothetical protein CMN55_03470 [Sneathiella sp.]|uniref:DUF2332 domain-containing protein n=1 Tax=Sneathiella sp. TaxID=1964365 RepID=UPI000C46AAE3|nr:DUF2332 family protein [Sneathiella sp.]MAL78162.1 hypothetical protein [Sneathiella sp.]